MTDAPFALQALTLPEITDLLAAIERNKKQIVCAPDVYEQVRDAVYSAGYGGWYRVVEHPWLDDGQVLLIPSEAEVMDVPFPTFPFGGHDEAPAVEAGA